MKCKNGTLVIPDEIKELTSDQTKPFVDEVETVLIASTLRRIGRYAFFGRLFQEHDYLLLWGCIPPLLNIA